MNAFKLLIPALSTCLLIAGAAPVAEAAKPPKKLVIHKAYFKAHLEGVQTSSWDATVAGTGGCDAGQHSQGTEVARFSSKPFRVKVTYFKGLHSPSVVSSKGPTDLFQPTTAKVTRRATHVANPAPAWCGGTDGSTGPDTSGGLFDCGTKTVSGGVAFSYSLLLGKGSDRIGLISRNTDDPFVNCAGASTTFPALLDQNTAGKPITSKLPRSEVFDRGIGKIIVLGRGKKISSDAGPKEETTLSWKVTLRRVKK